MSALEGPIKIKQYQVKKASMYSFVVILLHCYLE